MGRLSSSLELERFWLIDPPFLKRLNSSYTLRFSKHENLRFEDHTYINFPLETGVNVGKILSLLKAKKSPIILGWFHTDFLPEIQFSINK
jgi:hypothetical protein